MSPSTTLSSNESGLKELSMSDSSSSTKNSFSTRESSSLMSSSRRRSLVDYSTSILIIAFSIANVVRSWIRSSATNFTGSIIPDFRTLFGVLLFGLITKLPVILRFIDNANPNIYYVIRSGYISSKIASSGIL
jgi:hypothetical protein